jgi:site-specific recombinase XerD
MAGATLRDVQEMLGHRTASMTIRYSHLSPEHMRRVAAKAAL